MQSLYYLAAVSTAVLLTGAANAHMRMGTPIPFSAATLDNSPLAGDGSNFPCKLLYDEPSAAVLAKNTMAIGVPQTLRLIGSAVHGGGSCQVSLSTDLKPTNSSVWKVIHSIEGGCPANTDGNLPADPNGTGARTFQFIIPTSINPGKYTLAWTWFNRIGNREMYMNCAPIIVQPPKAKRYASPEPVNFISLSNRADLPDMFVANINGCTTTEGIDILFPDPGNSVEFAGTPSHLMKPGDIVCKRPNGAGPVVSQTLMLSSSPIQSAPTVSSNLSFTLQSPTSSAPPVSSASTALTSFSICLPLEVFPSRSASDASSTTTSASSKAATPPISSSIEPFSSLNSPASMPAPTHSLSSTQAVSTGGNTVGSACSPEGLWNCIDRMSFQRCGSGLWSPVMMMPQGTSCTSGVGLELIITP